MRLNETHKVVAHIPLGFDMSVMADGVYEEAIADIVGQDEMLSDSVIVKDINCGTVTPRQLSFSAPFELRGTSPQRRVAHAFILYFDTFFSATGEQVAQDVSAQAVKDGEVILAEVWRVGGGRSLSRTTSPERTRSPDAHSPTSPLRKDKLRRASTYKSKEKDAPKDTTKSFTTGPESVPTHWRQTLFLLREPIVMHEGNASELTHCK